MWWICSTVPEADILSELTDVSERLAQMFSLYHNIVSMQVAIRCLL
jgi:hypothetical protein